jgi:hypothetical protein
MGELCKFDELRLKTDNELLKLLNDDVELGIAAAGKALTASEDPSSAVESYVKAKRAHTEVSRLLSLAYGSTVAEKVGLQVRLHRLSRLLEALQSPDLALNSCGQDETASAVFAGC